MYIVRIVNNGLLTGITKDITEKIRQLRKGESEIIRRGRVIDVMYLHRYNSWKEAKMIELEITEMGIGKWLDMYC